MTRWEMDPSITSAPAFSIVEEFVRQNALLRNKLVDDFLVSIGATPENAEEFRITSKVMDPLNGRVFRKGISVGSFTTHFDGPSVRMEFTTEPDLPTKPKELPMRELTSHKVNGLNEELAILVCDGPGAGGACHDYRIEAANPHMLEMEAQHRISTEIRFQNGPILEAGVNGVSIEALLAIVEDRLVGFQSGEFASRENAVALTKVQEAMMWLQKRTRDRVARGVEGTCQK